MVKLMTKMSNASVEETFNVQIASMYFGLKNVKLTKMLNRM